MRYRASGLRPSAVISAALLAGCVHTSGVIPTGDGTFVISRSEKGFDKTGYGVKANALKEATAYCAGQGKELQIVNAVQKDMVLMTSDAQAEVVFRCGASPLQAASTECKNELQTADLDAIRGKVELYRDSAESAVPFAIATIDEFPTEAERVAIARWATLREACVRRTDAALSPPSSATPLQVTQFQQDRSFGQAMTARVGELIVALYQQKLTYGEFAKKRYEITRDAADAERQYRQSAQLADQQQRVQAQQVAQQQFQNSLLAWSIYMESVKARQPMTVHIDNTITVRR